MSERTQADIAQSVQVQLASDLKAKLAAIIDATVARDRDSASSEFEALVARLHEVFRAPAADGKHVRDQLAESLFPRLKSAFRKLFDQTSWIDPLKCAENLLGLIVAVDTCGEFADAVQQVVEEGGGGHGRDAFSFAGLTDFISVEEVLQLLGAGKHTGCLTLESATNHIEVYLSQGRLAFLNPRAVLRRVFPTRDAMGGREIPERMLQSAAKAFEKSGVPIAVSLHQHGFLRENEVREACKLLGVEVLVEFLHEPEPSTFCYRRVLDLPDFAIKYDLRVGITPFLLEGSKRLDDMSNMRRVFPDPDQPLRMQTDAFVRLGDLNLTPMEIKMLAGLNEGVSPRQLAQRVGLPMFETYQTLVRFAREGVVVPPGGLGALVGLAVTAEENLQSAFDLLDANDDEREVSNALDKAFGVDDPFNELNRSDES
ncbi:MAG: DUF4388 domain-containing protein [Planctomycetota bacterium]